MAFLSESEVHAAADEVDRSGGKVGPRPVHALLGRGSFSTISKLLENWEPSAPVVVDEPCPTEVLSALNRAGLQICETAFAAAMEIAGKDRPRLEGELADLKARVKDKADDLKVAIDENLALIAEFEELKATNLSLTEECANIKGQLVATREMIMVRRKPGPKPKKMLVGVPETALPAEASSDGIQAG